MYRHLTMLFHNGTSQLLRIACVKFNSQEKFLLLVGELWAGERYYPNHDKQIAFLSRK
jgi:hypothetical protein